LACIGITSDYLVNNILGLLKVLAMQAKTHSSCLLRLLINIDRSDSFII